MILSNKYILVISPEPWDHIFVSKHHYAIHLAKRGNKVFFLNPPSKAYSLKSTNYKNLEILDYKGFWKGLNRLPKFLRKLNVIKTFNRLERNVGLTFDIVWSFDNSVFYDFDLLPKNMLKISHIVDILQDYNSSKASKSANVCFGVIPLIVERHRKYNRHVYLIPHAVDIHSQKEKIELPGQHKKKVLYFGNLGMPDLDWELLEKALNHLCNIDFILIGSNHHLIPISEAPNLHYLESQPSELLINYMNAADLLIIFYKRKYLERYASPHKTLEYLSSGKPIVSTIQHSEHGIEELIYQTDNHVDWIKKIKSVLEFEESSLAMRRKEYVKKHTYDKQIDRIEKILASLPS